MAPFGNPSGKGAKFSEKGPSSSSSGPSRDPKFVATYGNFSTYQERTAYQAKALDTEGGKQYDRIVDASVTEVPGGYQIDEVWHKMNGSQRAAFCRRMTPTIPQLHERYPKLNARDLVELHDDLEAEAYDTAKFHSELFRDD